MQDETEQAQAYLAELQKLDQDHRLASLRTLAREFEPTLTRLPGLQRELERLMVPGDGIDYEALAARIEPVLKQATHFLLELDALPAALRQIPEIQDFIAELSATITLHTTTTLIECFRQRCEDVQTAQKKAEEAERRAREEAERRAREAAERKAREAAERKARKAVERKAREEAERKARETFQAIIFLIFVLALYITFGVAAHHKDNNPIQVLLAIVAFAFQTVMLYMPYGLILLIIYYSTAFVFVWNYGLAEWQEYIFPVIFFGGLFAIFILAINAFKE